MKTESPTHFNFLILFFYFSNNAILRSTLIPPLLKDIEQTPNTIMVRNAPYSLIGNINYE